MSKRVLVTGVSGFVGNHLVRELVNRGLIVDGLAHIDFLASELKPILGSFYVCDLTNPTQVAKLNLAPYDAIINLAGLANVGQSFDNPDLYMRVNVGVVTNFCQELERQRVSPRFIAISTGAVYDSSQSLPLTESSKLIEDGSPYAKSKLAMEKEVYKFKSENLAESIVVRPFNHVGPGQNEGFIVPDLFKKLYQSIQSKSPLVAGNLNTKRDYTDVRDVVRAYAELVTTDWENITSAVYNVCSGISRSGREILNELVKHIPGAENVVVTQDPKLMRKSDPPELVGSYEQLQSDIGWKPQIPFSQTIKDFIDYQLKS